MKLYYYLLSLCFFLITPIVCFGKVPSVPLHPAISEQLYGAGGPTTLDCVLMGSDRWAPPDAQVNSICNIAQTACVRYNLIERSIRDKTATDGANNDLLLAANDAEVKLRGCQLAMYTVVVEGNSLLDTSSSGDSKTMKSGK